MNTCSGVIKGITKCISLGTFLSIKQLILSKSELLVFLFEFESFRISATDGKYLFSLFAISTESVICSSLITKSSGKLLESELEPLLTLRRCFHMDLVSFELFLQFEKYLRLACLISCLVLLRYLL